MSRIQFGLLASVLAFGACAGRLPGPWPTTQTRTTEYRIGPGDILRVNVWQNAE